MAVMTFSDSHVWCYRKYNNLWYKLDSMALKPTSISFQNIFSQRGFGWIILWNKSSSELPSKKVSKQHQRHTKVST